MSHRICLASDPAKSGFPTDKSALWVHHKSDAPRADRCVEVDEFIADPYAHARGVDVVVVLNLVSKIVRPGSRVKYGQFLTEPWNGAPRVSVDSHLYIGQPWRMWWHWGCADAPFGEPSEKYHTSYRVETDWNLYTEDKVTNPCNMDRLRRYGSGLVAFRGGFKFDEVKATTIAMSEEEHALYQEEKEEAFEQCKTPAALLKRLAEFAALRCPLRHLPKDLFSSRSHAIVATDFGIDKYLVSKMLEQVSLTNDAAETFNVG